VRKGEEKWGRGKGKGSYNDAVAYVIINITKKYLSTSRCIVGLPTHFAPVDLYLFIYLINITQATASL